MATMGYTPRDMPCPKCGGAAIGGDHKSGTLAAIECVEEDCGYAATLWNRRRDVGSDPSFGDEAENTGLAKLPRVDAAAKAAGDAARRQHHRSVAAAWLQVECETRNMRLDRGLCEAIIEKLANAAAASEEAEQQYTEALHKLSDQLDRIDRMRSHADATLSTSLAQSKETEGLHEKAMSYARRCDQLAARGYWRRVWDALRGRSLA